MKNRTSDLKWKNQLIGWLHRFKGTTTQQQGSNASNTPWLPMAIHTTFPIKPYLFLSFISSSSIQLWRETISPSPTTLNWLPISKNLKDFTGSPNHQIYKFPGSWNVMVICNKLQNRPFIQWKKTIWWISSPHSSQRRNGPSAPLFFAEFWKDDTSKKGVPGPGAQTTLVVLWIHLIFLLMLRWTWLKVRALKGTRNNRPSLVLARLFGSYNNLDPFPCYVWMFPYLEKNVDSCYCMPRRWNRAGFSEWMVQTISLEGSSWSTFLLPRRFCRPVIFFARMA